MVIVGLPVLNHSLQSRQISIQKMPWKPPQHCTWGWSTGPQYHLGLQLLPVELLSDPLPWCCHQPFPFSSASPTAQPTACCIPSLRPVPFSQNSIPAPSPSPLSSVPPLL